MKSQKRSLSIPATRSFRFNVYFYTVSTNQDERYLRVAILRQKFLDLTGMKGDSLCPAGLARIFKAEKE